MISTYTYNSKIYYLIQLSYTDKKGRRHQPKFRKDKNGFRISSERMAKKLEVEYLIELQNSIENKKISLTFAEWHKIFINTIRLTFKTSTVQLYDSGLKKWLSEKFLNTQLTDFSKLTIHDFIFQEMELKGATQNTKHKMRKTLRRVFESALEEGLISRNPVNGIKVTVPPPKKLVLNTKEVEILLTEAKNINHPFYYHWALALLTGLRNGEMYALRWSNVDEVSKIITINCQWTNKDGLHSTKSNRDRVFPISNELSNLLLELRNIGPFEEHLKSLKKDDGVYSDFVLPRSSEWQHGEQARILKKFCKLIGITEIKFHDLRATFITNLLAQGVALPKVMALVGHARTDTTNEYLRLAGVNVKGSTEKLGYRLPNGSCAQVLDLKSV